MDSKFLIYDKSGGAHITGYGCCEHVGTSLLDSLKKDESNYWAYIFDFNNKHMSDTFKNIENLKIYLEYIGLVFDLKFEHMVEKSDVMTESEEAFKIIGIKSNKHFIMPHCLIRYIWWPTYHNVAVMILNLYKNFKAQYPLETYIAIASSYAVSNSRTCLPLSTADKPYFWFFPSAEEMVKKLKRNTQMHSVTQFGNIFYQGDIEIKGGFFEDYSERVSMKNFLTSLGSEEMNLSSNDMVGLALDKYVSARNFAKGVYAGIGDQHTLCSVLLLNDADIFEETPGRIVNVASRISGNVKGYNINTKTII